MFHLDLKPEEREVLLEVLEDELSELRMELADTDNAGYKDELKKRKEVLDRILKALQKAVV
jgi:hypothetical protein